MIILFAAALVITAAVVMTSVIFLLVLFMSWVIDKLFGDDDWE